MQFGNPTGIKMPSKASKCRALLQEPSVKRGPKQIDRGGIDGRAQKHRAAFLAQFMPGETVKFARGRSLKWTRPNVSQRKKGEGYIELLAAHRQHNRLTEVAREVESWLDGIEQTNPDQPPAAIKNESPFVEEERPTVTKSASNGVDHGNLERALALAEIGLFVFPCRSRDEIDPETGEILKGKEVKTPLTPHGFKDASVDRDKISAWWTSWPGALVGLPTGRINKIAVADLDKKNGKDWEVSARKAGLALPDTHTATTPSGGEHRYYRYPANVEKITSASDLFRHLVGSEKTGIDTRGDGGYVIAWGDLTPKMIADFAEWPTEVFADAMCRDRDAAHARYKEKQAPRREYPASDDLERAEAALRFVPSDNYDVWIKIGMALKTEFGERGRTAWDSWSQTSASFKDANPDKHWRSFNGSGIGIGSLFDLAKQGGYRPTNPSQGTESSEKNSQNSHGHENSGTAWDDPEPLVSKIEAWPYPIDAFPVGIRNAIIEASGIIQLPIELAGNCALSALSIASQALADVKRMPTLTGPTSLFLLAVAESGDRKSTCDKWFTTSIKAYQEEQREEFVPELKMYRAAVKAWKAKGRGIESAIECAAKKSHDTTSLVNDLSVHEGREPREPRVPSLIRVGDDSSEQLAFSLANKWPSAGIISAEAGSVFGGHAMGGDKIMRNLSLQNVIWDGGSHQVGRRTSECFEVRGARLTIGLQAQESVLREFCGQYGSLVRGIGFFARFLFAWPQSIQGERLILGMPPENPPAAQAFNDRLSEVINLPVSMDDDGALTPILLDMTEEARAAWVEVYNDIEKELRPLGDLNEIKDVASKAADNVARIAALFHVYQYGPTGRVGVDTIRDAAKLLTWHLNEARRFLGAFSMPPELEGAARIEDWVIKHCRAQGKGVSIVSRRELQQHGPHGLREKKELDAALAELIDLNRARLVQNGNKKEIHINPALLDVQR